METTCAFCHMPDGHEAGCPGDLRDVAAEDTARLANALGYPTVTDPMKPSELNRRARAEAKLEREAQETIAAEVDGAPATIVLNGHSGAPLELGIHVDPPSPEESMKRIAEAKAAVDECKEALVVPTAALRAAQKQLEEAVTAGTVTYWESRQMSLAEV